MYENYFIPIDTLLFKSKRKEKKMSEKAKKSKMNNFLAVNFLPFWNQCSTPDFVTVLFGRAEVLAEDQWSKEIVLFNFQVNVTGSIGNLYFFAYSRCEATRAYCWLFTVQGACNGECGYESTFVKYQNGTCVSWNW